MLDVAKKETQSAQIAIRIDPALLEQADALIGHITKKSGIPATRMGVLREALVRGIKSLSDERKRGNMGKSIEASITKPEGEDEAGEESLLSATSAAVRRAFPGASVEIDYSETSLMQIRTSDGIDEDDVRNVIQDAWNDWCDAG